MSTIGVGPIGPGAKSSPWNQVEMEQWRRTKAAVKAWEAERKRQQREAKDLQAVDRAWKVQHNAFPTRGDGDDDAASECVTIVGDETEKRKGDRKGLLQKVFRRGPRDGKVPR